MNFTNPFTIYITAGVLYGSYIVLSMAWDYFYSDQSYECQLHLIAFLNPFALAFGYFGIFLGSALAILILLLASALWPLPMFFEISEAIRKYRIRRMTEKNRRSDAEIEKMWAEKDAAHRAWLAQNKHDSLPEGDTVHVVQEPLTEHEKAILYYVDLHNTSNSQKGDQNEGTSAGGQPRRRLGV